MSDLASHHAVDDLRAINAQFIDNFVTNDVAAHDALLHPSFLYIRIDVTSSPPWRTVSLFVDRTSATSPMSTYTDTYVFEESRWQGVQAQITPVTEGNEPADDTIVSVWIMGVRQP